MKLEKECIEIQEAHPLKQGLKLVMCVWKFMGSFNSRGASTKTRIETYKDITLTIYTIDSRGASTKTRIETKSRTAGYHLPF